MRTLRSSRPNQGANTRRRRTESGTMASALAKVEEGREDMLDLAEVSGNHVMVLVVLMVMVIPR